MDNQPLLGKLLLRVILKELGNLLPYVSHTLIPQKTVFTNIDNSRLLKLLLGRHYESRRTGNVKPSVSVRFGGDFFESIWKGFTRNKVAFGNILLELLAKKVKAVRAVYQSQFNSGLGVMGEPGNCPH